MGKIFYGLQEFIFHSRIYANYHPALRLSEPKSVLMNPVTSLNSKTQLPRERAFRQCNKQAAFAHVMRRNDHFPPDQLRYLLLQPELLFYIEIRRRAVFHTNYFMQIFG